MSVKKHPTLEILEDRLTPTTYGVPFPDPQHLTVSFVPDGTAIGTSASDLFSLMDSTTPEAKWETQILRGLQAWAAVSNINLTVVPDDGAPLGTTAPLEGSPDFGDIRIAAAPLGNDLVATTTPFDPSSGSWSGAMIFNNEFTFGPPSSGGYNTYSVAVHEAGHVFGLPSNLDPTSVMFNYYNGVLTGLGTGDRTAIQALYGKRTADPWSSVVGGNATAATATNFLDAVQQQDITNVEQAGKLANASISYNAIDADLSTRNDSEYFQYQAQAATGGFTVNLVTAGQSLLEAQLTVVDQNGNVIDTIVATDPQNGNLSIYVPDAPQGEEYTIEVASAKGGAFGVGDYQLQIVPDNASDPSIVAANAALLQLLTADVTPHHSKANAAVIAPLDNNGPFTTATVILNNAMQSQWLDVSAPNAVNGGGGTLQITLYTTALGTPLPTITVETGGVVQPTTVVTEADGSVVLEVPATNANAQYYVKLQGAPGTFHLAFEFGYALPDVPQPETGALSLTTAGEYQFFTLNETGILQVQATASSTNPLAGYEVAIIDSNGTTWYDQFVLNSANLNLSTTLVLPEGTYEVRITVGTQDGSDPGTVPYTLGIKQLNAPLGPPVIDPEEPPPLGSNALWLEIPPAFLYSTNTDPYGSIFQYPIPGPPIRTPPLG